MTARPWPLAGRWQLGRRHLWVPAAVLSVSLFLAAAILWTNEPDPVEGHASAGTLAPAAARSTVAPLEMPPPTTATARPITGTPQQVVIQSSGVDAPVVPIVAEGTGLNPPHDPQELGWWSEGAHVGAATGTALITGHTVHDGGGALDDLETVRPGAEIEVRTARGTIRYVTDSVVVLDKVTIARRAPDLFSQEVDGRLVLVTCEGWDGTGYRSNVVLTAVPAR